MKDLTFILWLQATESETKRLVEGSSLHPRKREKPRGIEWLLPHYGSGATRTGEGDEKFGQQRELRDE